MVSLAQRYLGGEHEAVWNEIRRLGPVGSAVRSDVNAVAEETMRRVHRHVRRIVEGMTDLGFVPASSDLPMHGEPTDEDRRELARLEAVIGGVPAALCACMALVGEVWLTGDCPTLGLSYHSDPPTPESGAENYPDPLCLPGVTWLRDEWDEYTEDHLPQTRHTAVANDPDQLDLPGVDWQRYEPTDEPRLPGPGGIAGPDPDHDPFWFSFAPDELHKANVSGGTHDIALPCACADPVIENIRGRPGITLVEYLRLSVWWGGCPGWEFSTTGPPAALQSIRADPDF